MTLNDVSAEVGAAAEAWHEVMRGYGKRRNVPFADLNGSETSEAIFYAQAALDLPNAAEQYLPKHKERLGIPVKKSKKEAKA